jgi:hypothetical protein
MTCALRRAGAIRGTKVVEMTCKPVGNGLVGDSYRFGVAYEEVEPDAPARVIGKFPAADPDSRRSGSAHLLYLARCRSIASSPTPSPSKRPAPFVADIDPETDDSSLSWKTGALSAHFIPSFGTANSGPDHRSCAVDSCE